MKNEAADAPITFEEFVMVVINRLKMSMLSRISEQSLPQLLSLNLQVLPLQRNARTTRGFLFKHEQSNNCVSQSINESINKLYYPRIYSVALRCYYKLSRVLNISQVEYSRCEG